MCGRNVCVRLVCLCHWCVCLGSCMVNVCVCLGCVWAAGMCGQWVCLCGQDVCVCMWSGCMCVWSAGMSVVGVRVWLRCVCACGVYVFRVLCVWVYGQCVCRGQRSAAVNCLSLPQPWDSNHMLPHLAFYEGTGDRTQILMFVQQVPSLQHSSQQSSCYF